ncbi:hypothetical protein D3C71_1274110 [compost metagenome]
MSGPVIFHHVRYTVGDLRHLPDDDVVYIFMVTQFHNDVAALLALVSSNFPSEDQPMPLQVRGSVVSFMSIRLLAGRLEEGWKLIKDRFGKVFVKYSETMDPEATRSLRELRTYFGQKNLIRNIRDKAGFHFDRDLILEAYGTMSDGAEMVDYISRSLGNTIYFSAEGMITAAVLRLIPDRPNDMDNKAAIEFVIGEVARIANLFLNVTTGFTNEFYKANLKAQLEAMSGDFQTVNDQPELNDMSGLQFIHSETDRHHSTAAPANRQERRMAHAKKRRAASSSA